MTMHFEMYFHDGSYLELSLKKKKKVRKIKTLNK